MPYQMKKRLRAQNNPCGPKQMNRNLAALLGCWDVSQRAKLARESRSVRIISVAFEQTFAKL